MASRSGRAAMRRTPAHVCSSDRSSVASRRRLWRRWPSSPTWGRAPGPTWREYEASPPIRQSRASSSAGSSPRRDARTGLAAPSATGRHRCSSACSGSRASPRSRASTISARTPRSSASACSRSQKPRSRRAPQICQAPPRRTGTAWPSFVIPSTSSSRLPIMKSMCTLLLFTRVLSAASSTGWS